MLQSSIWQKSNYGDKAQPCGWPHRNGLICLCSKRYGYRIQPQFTNLYHFHVADTPLDLSISVYSFVFCAQPYLCSRSSLKLKKKKQQLSFPSFSLGPLSLHKHFSPKFWSTWFFCLLGKKKQTSFFRAV